MSQPISRTSRISRSHAPRGNAVPAFPTLVLLLATACGPLGEQAPEPSSQNAATEIHQDDHDESHKDDEAVVLTPEAARRAGLRTAPIEERVLESELATTGHVDFDENRLQHVSPRITGRVHNVRVRLGQDVQAGDTLAEVDSIELGRAKADYLQLRAKEELARTNHERQRTLLTEGIASEQSVLAAEAEVREAIAALRTSEETLHLYGLGQQHVDALGYDDPASSIYPLRATLAGTIVERHATLGELVTPERNLFTLADLSQVWIWIDVPQRSLGRVHIGDGVRARVDSFPDELFSGTVSYLSAQVDTDTRTVRARLDVPNPARKLRPGMFVDIELSDPHESEGGRERAASRVVPESAALRDGDTLFVFVVAGEQNGGGQRYERREIRAGRRIGGWVEILEGPETGTAVVVEGSFVLKSAASSESLGTGHAH